MTTDSHELTDAEIDAITARAFERHYGIHAGKLFDPLYREIVRETMLYAAGAASVPSGEPVAWAHYATDGTIDVLTDTPCVGAVPLYAATGEKK